MPSSSRPASSDEKAIVFRLNDEIGSGPEIVRTVFFERGWTEYDSSIHSDWNLWWKSGRFRANDYNNLQSWQRLNHHPAPKGGNMCITSKDGLLRNMRRLRGVHGANVYNFAPGAFHLPREERLFKEEFSRMAAEKDQRACNFWICKPSDQSRGRGIFIFNQVQDLRYAEKSVVQQYICNPFLISNYKFDLRIYVTVASYKPLVIYAYKDGIVRFSTERYDLGALDNVFAHLTNTSINKYGPSYTTDKVGVGSGCKWTFQQLRYHLYQRNLNDRGLWAQIVGIIILTIISQIGLRNDQVVRKANMPPSHNCFELFGFDVLFDSDLKPWLLEVNFSPALSFDCPTDSQVKKRMLHDLLDLVSFRSDDSLRGSHHRPRSTTQHFTHRSYRRQDNLQISGKRISRPSLNRPRMHQTHVHSAGDVPSYKTRAGSDPCDSGVSSAASLHRGSSDTALHRDPSNSTLNLEAIAEDDSSRYSTTRRSSMNRPGVSLPYVSDDRPAIRGNRASYLRSRSLSRQYEHLNEPQTRRRFSNPNTSSSTSRGPTSTSRAIEAQYVSLVERAGHRVSQMPQRRRCQTFGVSHEESGGQIYPCLPDGRRQKGPPSNDDSDFEDDESSEREVDSRLGIVGLAHATAAEASGLGLDGKPPENPLYGPPSFKPVTDPPKRFGDYYLVLPFNAATRKAVQTGDEKTLVKETQKLVKHRIRENRENRLIEDKDLFDVFDPWLPIESR